MATKAPPVSKDKARYELKRAADKRAADDERASESNLRWESWVLDAYNAGLTYDEIAEISYLSRPRIDQVLRKERERRGLPIGTKAKPTTKVSKNGKK